MSHRLQQLVVAVVAVAADAGALLVPLVLVSARPDEQVARRRLAALDLHELVELEHPALAAAVALAALVKNGSARVVDAVLVVGPLLALLIGRVAPFPPTLLGVGDLELGLVVFGLGGRWRCRGGGLGHEGCAARCRRDGLGQLGREGLRSWGYIGGLFPFLNLGRVVSGAVLPLGARGDREELVEGEESGLATFPAWRSVGAVSNKVKE